MSDNKMNNISWADAIGKKLIKETQVKNTFFLYRKEMYKV